MHGASTSHILTVYLISYHLSDLYWLCIISRIQSRLANIIKKTLIALRFMAGEALSTKDRKPLFSGFVETGMVEELRTLALYLREVQLREKFGGILD